MRPRPSPDELALLRRNELLASLDARQAEEVLSFAIRTVFAEDQTIFAKGDPGDSLYAIIEGQVAVETFSEDGKSILLNLLGPGDVLGEIAMLDGGERTAGARATQPTVCWRILRQDFMPFLLRQPALSIRLMEVLCKRLRWTSGIIEDTIFLAGQKRLAARILKLARTHGRAENGQIRITQPFSQEKLAQMLGTTRETVNRAMRVLVRNQAVRYEGGRLVILDPTLIERLSR